MTNPKMNNSIPELVNAVNQLDGWDRAHMQGRKRQILKLALRVHYLATQVLSESQDKYYNGEY